MPLELPPKPAIILPAERQLIRQARALHTRRATFPMPTFIMGKQAKALTAVGPWTQDTANQTDYVFSSVDFGSAASGRRLIVAAHGTDNTASTDEVIIGGVTATLVRQGHVNNVGSVSLWIALLEAGTSGTVNVNHTGGKSTCSIYLWHALGLENDTPVDADGTGLTTMPSLTIDTLPNGFAVVAITGDTGNDGLDFDFTNATRRYNENQDSGVVQAAGGDTTTASTSLSLTGTGVNPFTCSMIAASW